MRAAARPAGPGPSWLCQQAAARSLDAGRSGHQSPVQVPAGSRPGGGTQGGPAAPCCPLGTQHPVPAPRGGAAAPSAGHAAGAAPPGRHLSARLGQLPRLPAGAAPARPSSLATGVGASSPPLPCGALAFPAPLERPPRHSGQRRRRRKRGSAGRGPTASTARFPLEALGVPEEGSGSRAAPTSSRADEALEPVSPAPWGPARRAGQAGQSLQPTGGSEKEPPGWAGGPALFPKCHQGRGTTTQAPSMGRSQGLARLISRLSGSSLRILAQARCHLPAHVC